MRDPRNGSPLRSLFVLALLLTACASGGFDAGAQAKGVEQDNTVRIYKKVAPATVFIKSALTSDYPISGLNSSIGSGVILDRQGLILTNAHVVDKAARILVVLHDGTRLTASFVGDDLMTDLALLRVNLPDDHHATAELGNSDRVEIGQEVVAIGHPFGLGYALTTGVVSGFGTSPDPQAPSRARVIQTSAAINPGNSGGPLVDMKGSVIGINTATLVGGQNIGFAIPINAVKAIVAELQAHGRVVRPWLGVAGKLVPKEIIDLFAMPLAKGLLVVHVDEGSPAHKAGLRAGALNVTIEGEPWVLGGDIVLAVNGLELTTVEQYVSAFRELEVGESVQLRIFRNGSYQDLFVMIEELPQMQTLPPQTRIPETAGFGPMKLPCGPQDSRPVLYGGCGEEVLR